MTFSSALYVGSVMHRRLRPRRHRLRHAVFWMLIDLDELNAVDRSIRLFSRNRFNAVSFFDRDHGEQTDEPLRSQVERHLRTADVELDGGAIRLFCMPRIFGYAFNPISIYFCHREDGSIAALLYEVRNTFGERHSYLIPVTPSGGAVIQQSCDKGFYVSPFLAMAMRYEFRVVPPTDTVSVAIEGADTQGPMIFAALSARRAPLTDAALARVLIGIPLLTLKVTAAIHWHALKMWLKGFTLQTRPSPPLDPVTIVHMGKQRT